MVGGDPGPAGLAAPSLVVQDLDQDLEGVIIRLQPMAGEIVQGQAQPQKTVTHDVAQLMESGVPGLSGPPAASHVAQEQDLAQEAAVVPDLLVEGKAALVQVP